MIIEIKEGARTDKVNSVAILRIERNTLFLKGGKRIEHLTDDMVQEIISLLSAHNVFDNTFDNTFD